MQLSSGICGGYSSLFIPVYGILIKCAPIVKHTRTVFGKKANRCSTISELALNIKESGRVNWKSDTIFRCPGLVLVSNAIHVYNINSCLNSIEEIPNRKDPHGFQLSQVPHTTLMLCHVQPPSTETGSENLKSELSLCGMSVILCVNAVCFLLILNSQLADRMKSSDYFTTKRPVCFNSKNVRHLFRISRQLTLDKWLNYIILT